jgi:hypothetical protein
MKTAGAIGNHVPTFGNIPLYFIPNNGQAHENVAFYARTSGYTLWMTREGLIFDGIKKTGAEGKEEITRDVTRFLFPGANPNPGMVPVDLTSHTVNYLKGNDASKWETGIRTSKAVLYTDIYHNVDLKVYGVEKQVEYDWIVKPGGDPAGIRFLYKGAESTGIDNDGNLIIESKFGALLHKRPFGYQVLNGKQAEVSVDFVKAGPGEYRFRVGRYDRTRELIIDPVVLTYSTYLGGSGDEHGFGLAVDTGGRAYVTGDTYSTNFPIEDAYQSTSGGGNRDAFVTKFSTSGSPVYSTYLGGSGDDTGGAIQLDGSGNAYIVGFSDSTDFPLKNAYQTTNKGGRDIIVCKLSSSGKTLSYSTYLGGTKDDEGFAIALDGSNNIYITGRTYSSDFPTANAYRDTFRGGDMDAFVTRISSSGTSLDFSTYLGGNNTDTGYGIAVTGNNTYVAGRTGSTNFPTQNEVQGTYGGGTYDAFVTRFSSSGSSLIYSTYLGGSGTDSGYGIDVDSGGNAYVTGDTAGGGFPTQDAFQGTYGGGEKDAFVAKFANDASLDYCTFIGGLENDQAAYILVNGNGNACIVGSTRSSNFPLAHAYQDSYSGDFDAFVSLLSVNGKSLNFSTLLGGGDYDSGRAVGMDNNGNIYAAGFTESSDFPTENAVQGTRKGTMDAFVTKFSIPSEYGTLCGAVDNCQLTWTTGGDGDWYDQTQTYYYDGDAAKSADVSDYQSTYIQTTVTGPGLLRFHWKITSDSGNWNWNYLEFDIDDYYYNSIGGNVDWDLETYSIGTGTHTLRWTYYSSYYNSPGYDCGWLDKVEFTPLPEIELNRTQMTFGASGGTASGPQTFSISSKTSGNLDWTATPDQAWLTCSPDSGSGDGIVTVSVDAAGLSVGTYTGTIVVSDPNASNSPQAVGVTLDVYRSGGSSDPFGNYATPTDGSTISSSVPFTGWVLDDIGVESVKLYRKEGAGLVYIGDAVFVEGARPDVEAAYPDYPFNYRAGWGYMMLTNFLPNGGNGTFTILAIATDVEGNQVTLGSKTVTVDNANAVDPFGAIDTPTQGGPASGDDFRNHGWVLTPMPNTVPTDGSTIKVFVDGVELGHVTYNLYRSDIATLFPGYSNSDGAHAYFDFDTTAYSNGVHTISWIAEDDAGNADGIGSRYFMIDNSAAGAEGTAARTAAGRQGKVNINPVPGGKRLSDIPAEYSGPVGVIKGFRTDIDPVDIYPDGDGTIDIEVRELERVELHFGAGRLVSGCMTVGDEPRPLPPGSTLDTINGIFSWQLGPAIVGEYTLVFIETGKGGDLVRRNALITVQPRF